MKKYIKTGGLSYLKKKIRKERIIPYYLFKLKRKLTKIMKIIYYKKMPRENMIKGVAGVANTIMREKIRQSRRRQITIKIRKSKK